MAISLPRLPFFMAANALLKTYASGAGLQVLIAALFCLGNFIMVWVHEVGRGGSHAPYLADPYRCYCDHCLLVRGCGANEYRMRGGSGGAGGRRCACGHGLGSHNMDARSARFATPASSGGRADQVEIVDENHVAQAAGLSWLDHDFGHSAGLCDRHGPWCFAGRWHSAQPRDGRARIALGDCQPNHSDPCHCAHDLAPAIRHCGAN
ncbi:MAG: hypothetical protein U5N55_03775 [Cypionkella sp.]|nr:hypothetical protein [Cypionkella sp.]